MVKDMKYEIKEQQLIIYLQGEINSSTADNVEKEIDLHLQGQEFKSVVLDMAELVYMSSAGIRIVMKLKQRYDDLTLNNVPDGVYEVLHMVGVTNFIKTNKLEK